MNQEAKVGKEIWLVIERLKEDSLLTPEDEAIHYEVLQKHTDKNYPIPLNQRKIIKKLEHDKAIEIINPTYGFIDTIAGAGASLGLDEQGFFIKILKPKFETLYSEYSKYANKLGVVETEVKELVISYQDREIYINDFLLARPLSTGKNLEFFEYIFKNAGKLVKRDELPVELRNAMSATPFTKTLSKLGFTGLISTAFLPKRDKDMVQLRKKVSIEELESAGMKTSLLLQQLKTAHVKHSPT